MRKSCWLSILFAGFLLWIVSPTIVLAEKDRGLTNDQKSARQRLEAQSKRPIRLSVDRHLGVPSMISLKVPAKITRDPKKAARDFLQKYKDLFKIKDQAKELKHSRSKRDKLGIEHIHFKQEHQGLPVFGTGIIVHIGSDGMIHWVNGKYLPNITVSTLPMITAQASTAAAMQDLGESTAKILSAPELMIFDPGCITGESREDHLVWKLTLVFRAPLGQWVYFVDAHRGEVVFKYNNLKDVKERNTYTAGNTETLPGTLCLTENETYPCVDIISQTAHDHMGTTYDYYYNTFGRDSFDDNDGAGPNGGAAIVSSVHYGSNFDNAHWNGELIYFGDGDGVTYGPFGYALDVVAHEFTHAVTDYEAGLVYTNEPGALNEAFSDILAVMVDRDNWLLGEDSVTPGIPGDAIRSLASPSLYGHPESFFDYEIAGDVHTNSGIANKAAYLISEGGTHHYLTITGIGRVKTEQIFYYALTNILIMTSDFRNLYDAILQAAEILYGIDGPEAQAVEKAFNSVGLGLDTDNDSLPDVWEGDTDGDGVMNYIEYMRGTSHLDDTSYPVPKTIYVDMNDSACGTEGNPLCTIQEGIDTAQAGDTVSVNSGTYPENITITKPIVLTCSADPRAALTGLQLKVTGMHWGAISGFDVTTNAFPLIVLSSNILIQGNTFRNMLFSGIWISNSSNITLLNNVITNNGLQGVQVKDNASVILMNNTITNNSEGVRADAGSQVTIKNSIVSNNTDNLEGVDPTRVFYSYIGSGEIGFGGNWNILGDDPSFVDPTSDDGLLQSRSLCIDSGDLSDDYSNEPENNGDRMNMGAYGNTVLAAVGMDSDSDGLTNQNEACYDGDCSTYNPYDPISNPEGGDLNYDNINTDGDDYDDKTEIEMGTDPLHFDVIVSVNDGDMNQDGVVNVLDVFLLEKMTLGLIVPTSDDLLYGDLAPVGNPDGVIDLSDVLLVIQKCFQEPNF